VSQALRILIHSCRLLHPLHGGDRIRTYNMLRELRKRHRLTYLCLRTRADQPDAVDRALEYCHELITVDHPATNQRSLRFYARVVWNTCFGKYPFEVIRFVAAVNRGTRFGIDEKARVALRSSTRRVTFQFSTERI